LFADNPVLAFDPMKPGRIVLDACNHDNLFLTMNTDFFSNHFTVSALACAALLTAGCTEKNAPQARRMTNGVPLALDDELQNQKDGKWYWRDTTNLFTGIELLHHTNGVIKLHLPFTNGVPHGHRTMWHPNGQKESEGDVVSGQRSGPWKMWFPNGKPDKQGTFSNGKPDGLQIFWHTNGVKSIEWQHKEGYPHGEMTSYHENGRKKQHGFYETNRQHGKWIAWDESGEKIREAEFDKGKLVSEKNFEEPEAEPPKQ
jgi:antitoxin component YwqK of YwqJK toxin-antitoxin module